MASLAQIRKQYPQYSDLSDQQLADALYRTHYSDMPRPEFDRSIGMKTEPPPPDRRGGGLRDLVADGIGAPRDKTAWGRLASFAQAATEQVPFLDEAAAYTAAKLNGVSYEDMRKRQAELADEDRKNYRAERNAGGIAGFGATLFAPGGAYVGRAKSLGEATVRAAQVGAGYGALAGAGAADDGVGNRVKGAATGAVLGAVAGGATPSAVKLAQAAPKAFRRAAQNLPMPKARGAAPAPAPVAEVAEESIPAAAERYVQRLVRSSGLTPEQLAAAPSDVTAAEALGRSGQTGLGALARREGASGDALDAIVAERQLTRPQRLLEGFTDASGISPAAAVGDIESVVASGRAQAAPLYAEAEDFGPVMSPKLGGLLARPSVRKAMARARSIAAEEGRNPDALGLVDVEVPGAWDSFVDMVSSEAPKIGRAPARTPSRGYSLAQFVGRNGGIADEGGELAAMGADRWHVGRPYQRGLIGPGNADDMALRAWEAGYFPNHQVRPTIDEFYGALADEMRGKPSFARMGDEAAQQRFDARSAAEEYAARGGHGPDELGMIPDDVANGGWLPDADEYVGTTRQRTGYVGRPAPQTEPAFEAQPTAETWDYVKRGLDDVLEGYRDKTTGRLKLDEEGRAVLQTLGALRGELTSINPAYKRALETSSDYLSANDAFKKGEAFLFDGKVTERQFAEHLGRLQGGQLEAFRGGIGNKLFDLAQNGRLDPKLFKAPRVQQKLRMALGNDAAAKLLSVIEREGQKLGFERRYAPGANSITAEMRAAMDEQDALGGGMQKAIDDFLSEAHRGFGAGVVKAGQGALRSGIATLRTPGMPINARDEAGRLLMGSPQDLATYVRNLPPPKPLAPPKRGVGLRAVPAVSAYAGARGR